MQTLFPFAAYWWFYAVFTAVVIALLVVDLRLHRDARPIPMPEAGLWTVFWIALAIAFCYGLYAFTAARFTPAVARQVTMEFLAGYLLEEALSIDNMFVFALVFRYFGIPGQFQHRVLFYGVLGAMVFRAIFIALGAALLRFDWVMIAFGLFLIYTGVRMAFAKDQQVDPGHSAIVRWVRRFVRITPDLNGHHFFERRNGFLYATPLLVVLLFLETTDVVFAIDSVPAVFGVTREPLVVYTSNVFAILGLRSLYFLLAGAMGRFHALQYGLAFVLAFVGLKMVWLDRLFGGHFPIGASLAVIAIAIGISIAVSLHVLLHTWAGGLCLVLAAASLAAALGPARRLSLLEHTADIEAQWFYLSAACWALAGGLLIRRSPPRPSPPLPYPPPPASR